MSESTENLKHEIYQDLKKIFPEKVNDKDAFLIQRAIHNRLTRRKFDFYNEANSLKTIDINEILAELKWTHPADSKAEMECQEILSNNGIPFRFQYQIGPYRVDFLIDDFLIFELDGDQHYQQIEHDQRRDKYLSKLGYRILRIPIWLLAATPESVIREIKKLMEYKGPYPEGYNPPREIEDDLPF